MTAPRVLVVRGGVPCHGTVRTPGEKSISHRAVLFAALAEGTSVIHGLSDGADVAATLAAVEALGASVERAADGTVTIRGGRGLLHEPGGALDCGNSGTSMRLLAGVAAGLRVGDRADRRRIALVAPHGPGCRAARSHGGNGQWLGARVQASTRG